MIVVADTSPLNYLIQIDTIDLLPRLFERVYVPNGVLAELRHERSPAKVRSWTASAPSWLERRTPIRIEGIPKLHSGEVEAIALAQELSAPILIDDRDAARAAMKHGLLVLGTLAVLIEGANRNFIHLESTINKLRQTNFRMPAKLVEEILQRQTSNRSEDQPEA